MVSINVECVLRYMADKTYQITEDEYAVLIKNGTIPDKVKEDILDYTPLNGEEKNNFIIRIV